MLVNSSTRTNSEINLDSLHKNESLEIEEGLNIDDGEPARRFPGKKECKVVFSSQAWRCYNIFIQNNVKCGEVRQSNFIKPAYLYFSFFSPNDA